MMNFNFTDYLIIDENKVLKIKLRNSDNSILVKRVSQSVLQPFQSAYTPITKINLDVIKDLDLYKREKDNDENTYEVRVEPQEVEQFELIELSSL